MSYEIDLSKHGPFYTHDQNDSNNQLRTYLFAIAERLKRLVEAAEELVRSGRDVKLHEPEGQDVEPHRGQLGTGHREGAPMDWRE